MTATPRQSWQQMLDGNARFVSGGVEHPHQDAERRTTVASGQVPVAALFGCSDSRLAAEIIFDQGLGDLFVVRNAGQVVADSVVGSLEYAVGVLRVPLIVVLAHDACGAVRAAIDSLDLDSAPLPAGIWRLIAPIVPAAKRVLAAHVAEGLAAADLDADEVGREHLRSTITQLLHSSELISDAVAAGDVAIVGAQYRLSEGTVTSHVVVGEV